MHDLSAIAIFFCKIELFDVIRVRCPLSSSPRLVLLKQIIGVRLMEGINPHITKSDRSIGQNGVNDILHSEMQISVAPSSRSFSCVQKKLPCLEKCLFEISAFYFGTGEHVLEIRQLEASIAELDFRTRVLSRILRPILGMPLMNDEEG